MPSHPDVVDQILGRTKTKDLGTVSSAPAEPPSGVQGKGTIDEPYDQGNAPGKQGGKPR
jgi:hypothetical protein